MNELKITSKIRIPQTNVSRRFTYTIDCGLLSGEYVQVLVEFDRIIDHKAYFNYWMTLFNQDKGGIIHARSLFAGIDLGIPHGSNMMGEEKIALTLLSFLTLRPGDTDSEYFDTYTEDQLTWCNSYACESLSGMVSMREETLNNR